MTFEDKIKSMLTERGLFPDQANAIMETMKASEIHKSMTHRWHGDVEDYPQSVLVLLWHSARETALEYIDTECPKAWLRPMFAEYEATAEDEKAAAF